MPYSQWASKYCMSMISSAVSSRASCGLGYSGRHPMYGSSSRGGSISVLLFAKSHGVIRRLTQMSTDDVYSICVNLRICSWTLFPSESRVQKVPQAVADDVERQREGQDGQAREGTDPPLVEVVAAGRDHRAPLGYLGRRPQPQETQGSESQNRVTHVQGAHDDDGRNNVGEHVVYHDPELLSLIH